jgi:glycosyltransferase involved in cell wall biosynthesis
MPEMPLVSIAAINYNNAKYIIETLESIRKQTYANIELIIVDDCSTDNCVELITEWLKTFKGPYKLVQHEKNKGVCVACNTAVKSASGKYYAAIATDDIMLPEKIEKQVAILEATNSNVAAVYSDAYTIDEHSKNLEGLFIQHHRNFLTNPTGNIYNVLLDGNYIPGMSFLFKRNIFDEVGLFDESLIYEDYDMWLRIARKYEIIFSEFVAVKYRIRPGSLVSTIKNWIYSDAKIFLKHADAGSALPIQRLKNIASEAYRTNDEKTLLLVKELAEKINNTYLFTAYLLWYFGIPFSVGEVILAKKDMRIYADSVSTMTTDSRLTLLMDQLSATLPEEGLKDMVRDAYANNNSATQPIVRSLFQRTQNRYYKTILLLWKFKVRIPNGLIILDRINGYCSVNVSKQYIDLCIYKDIFNAIKTGNSSYLKRQSMSV